MLGPVQLVDEWLRTYSPLQASLILTTAVLVVAGLSALARVYWKSFLNLNGPPADSFVKGSLPSLAEAQTGALLDEWFTSYGSTVLFRNSLWRPQIFTRDTNFINAVLHSPDFGKSELSRRLTAMTGAKHSIAALEGDDHRRVKKALVPALGPAAMRQYWPDMLDRVNALLAKITRDTMQGAEPQLFSSTTYCGLLTVEMLGKSGFGMQFDAIDKKEPGKLEQALGLLAQTQNAFGLIDGLDIALGHVLGWASITRRQKKQAAARRLLEEETASILATRKAQVVAELSHDAKRDEFGNRDMISIWLRANLAGDISESSRVSDRELRDMIPLILLAGNTTTSNTMAWTLHYLAKDQRVQDKLRQEVQSLASDDASFDEVNKLEYLDAVVREATRCYSAAATQSRDTVRKTTVRLSEPVKGRDGQWLDSVTLDKGTVVWLPTPNVNTYQEVMGSDASEFRPERHLSKDMEGAKVYNSAWGNHLTFSAGERSCMRVCTLMLAGADGRSGFRFATTQIKCLVFLVLRRFEVVNPKDLVVRRSGQLIGTKTEVWSEGQKLDLYGLPVIFKPLQ